MLICTADGWKPIAPPTAAIEAAKAFRDRMAADLAQLCPDVGPAGARRAASLMFAGLATTHGAPA